MNPCITELPNNIKHLLLEFLNKGDLLRFGSTCRSNRQLINSPHIWISRILSDLNKDEIEYLNRSKNILSDYAKIKRKKLTYQKVKEVEIMLKYDDILLSSGKLQKYRLYTFICCVCWALIFALVASI